MFRLPTCSKTGLALAVALLAPSLASAEPDTVA